MTDIVTRLRGFIDCDGGDMADIAEAADEIERLRCALQDIAAVDPTNEFSSQSGMAKAALKETP